MKWLRAISFLLIIFATLFTAFYGRYKISEEGVDVEAEKYKGVITMWQIDSFEGGIGSRKQFLLKVSRAFEKENNGVLVMVINQTVKGAEDDIKKGNLPDIISYGCGIDVCGYGKINPNNTVLGGMVGDSCYATAWCRGGYVLIANPNIVKNEVFEQDCYSEITVSQGEYTQPITGLLFEGIKAQKVTVMQPMDAYVKFVSGKTPYLLGTQRDINRLTNRGMEFIAKPLTQFNDLFQYVSVTSTDQTKRYYAEEFVKFLVDERVQTQLNTIGMLSAFYDVENQTPTLNEMQKIKESVTVSAFTDKNVIKEMQRISKMGIEGDTDALNKIKNMCVIS